MLQKRSIVYESSHAFDASMVINEPFMRKCTECYSRHLNDPIVSVHKADTMLFKLVNNKSWRNCFERFLTTGSTFWVSFNVEMVPAWNQIHIWTQLRLGITLIYFFTAKNEFFWKRQFFHLLFQCVNFSFSWRTQAEYCLRMSEKRSAQRNRQSDTK